MSGQTTTWFRNARLQQTFRGVALGFTSFDVALTRRPPASNADVTQLDEFFQNGYARANVLLGASYWTMITPTLVANAAQITFARVGGTGIGTITGWALIAKEANKVAAVGTLVEPIRVVGGIRPILGIGAISFSEQD